MVSRINTCSRVHRYVHTPGLGVRMLKRSGLFVWILQQMCRLSDRMSKAATLNCRRATDGSITAKVKTERRKSSRRIQWSGGQRRTQIWDKEKVQEQIEFRSGDRKVNDRTGKRLEEEKLGVKKRWQEERQKWGGQKNQDNEQKQTKTAGGAEDQTERR